MYRTTTDKAEDTSGSKYMTYFKPDRQFYTGKGAQWIKNVNNVDKVYENTYKTTKDIKVATAKDVQDSIERISKKDKNFNEKAAKAFADFTATKNAGIYEKPIRDVYYNKAKHTTSKEFWSKVAKGEEYMKNRDVVAALRKSYGKEYNNLSKENKELYNAIYRAIGDKYIRQYLEASYAIKDKTNPTKATFYKTSGFDTEEGSKLRDEIVKDLKKHGYGAMSDIAGMGGVGNNNREARQTMHVFDTENNLNRRNTKEIKNRRQKRQTKKYDRWSKKTKSYSSLRYQGSD